MLGLARKACALKSALPSLISRIQVEGRLGVDLEGAPLGRFGRLNKLQLQVGEESCVFSSDLEEVLSELRPVLEDPDLIKVMFDSREDASYLLANHGIQLASVFDCQIANYLILEDRRSTSPEVELALDGSNCQAGLASVLQAYDLLSQADFQLIAQAKENFQQANFGVSDEYARLGVKYLNSLMDAQCREVDIIACLGKSRQNAEVYPQMNRHFEKPSEAAKVGTKLEAMLTSRKAEVLYFKLNLGCQRTGVTSTPSALKRLKQVEYFDVLSCAVSGVSIDGKFIYLDVWDPDFRQFDLKRRPRRFVTKCPGKPAGEDPHLVPEFLELANSPDEH